MPVARLLPGASQRNALQDRHVVAHYRGLADHHPGAVIDQDALPQPRRGVQVEREHRGYPRLQRQSQQLLAEVPQRVLNAVRLEGVEHLEVEQRVDVALARGVALVHRLDVAPDRGAHEDALLVVREEDAVEDFHQLRREQRRVRESIRLRRDATRRDGGRKK